MGDKMNPDVGDDSGAGVIIRNVIGDIRNSIIAGRDVIINKVTGTTADQRAFRNRQAMLQLVKNSWVKGVLEQSLHGATMIELGMEEWPDAVEQPWDMVVRIPDRGEREISQGTRIIDIFHQMNSSLLILGDPGSGKTTMLLKLARDTIAQAEKDPMQPIPVVFNLSSWAAERRSLSEWLVDEFDAKYRVSERIARPWIANDELLLLLDGLDEVPEKHRKACVDAINEFRQEHGLAPIVVCSRVADYEKLNQRIKLDGAVCLKPLSPDQIDNYLREAGPQMASLRALLRQDEASQELAQLPLTLSVMTMTYMGQSPPRLDQCAPIEEHRDHLFEAYIDRMFDRITRTKRALFPADRVQRWLRWLAAKLQQHGHSEFLIEQMQPSWLPTSSQKARYSLLSRLVGAIIAATSLSLGFLPLAWSWMSRNVPGFPQEGFWPQLVHILSFSTDFPVLALPPLVCGIVAGTVFGLLDMRTIQREHAATTGKSALSNLLTPGNAVTFATCVVGISSGCALRPFLPADIPLLLVSLPGGVLALVVSLFFAVRVSPRSARTDIQTSEALRWSWGRFARRFLLIGVVPTITVLAYHTVNLRSTAFVWSPSNGNRQVDLEYRSAPVEAAALDSEGMSIATGSTSGEVRIWNARTGEEVLRLEGHQDKVRDVEWGFNDTRVLTAGRDNRAIVWDAKTGVKLLILRHAARLQQAEWNADDTLIATTGYDGVTAIWNATTGDLLHVLPAREREANRFAWSWDGARIAVTSPDNAVTVWDAQTGRRLHTLKGHSGFVRDLAWSPDDKQIVSGAADRRLIVWDSQTGSELLKMKLPAISLGANALAWSPDGDHIAATCYRSRTRVWSAQTGELLAILGGLRFTLSGGDDLVAWNDSGSVLATAAGRKIRLWAAGTWEKAQTLGGHSGGVSGMQWSSDGRRMLAAFGLPDRRRDVAGLILLMAFLVAAITGLGTAQVDSKTRPNEGIALSTRNSLFVGLIATPLVGAAVGGVVAIGFERQAPIATYLQKGLLCSLLLGPLVMLWYGMMDVLQHVILRMMFNRTAGIPLNIVRFLDYATERIFLQKAGGRYIFVHRLLQEHFASLYREEHT